MSESIEKSTEHARFEHNSGSAGTTPLKFLFPLLNIHRNVCSVFRKDDRVAAIGNRNRYEAAPTIR